MSETLTCGVRTVLAEDGTAIPVPVGGLGVGGGDEVIVRDNAEIQISKSDTGAFYVVLNNADPANSEATDLFVDLAAHTAIKRLEVLAVEALGAAPSLAFKALGLGVGVLVSVFTPSALTREIFIRTSLEMPQPVDGPPVTYCLLV